MIIKGKYIFGFLIIVLLTFFAFCVLKVSNVNGNISSDYTDNVKKVIIDAGHGGVDGGAVADDGTNEKDINLDIALKTEDLLSFFGYETIMTRKSDISIHNKDAESIRQKKVSDIMNRFSIIKNNPDAVFVSIHQNKFPSSKYKGAQIFYSPNNPLSVDLANEIQNSFISVLQPDNQREIKKCGTEVYLIYHATSPAVLAECGFISNVEELNKLKTANYRQQVALTIVNGIDKYYYGSD